MAIPYRTAKFKFANIFAMVILGPTTKFNSRQLYSIYFNTLYCNKNFCSINLCDQSLTRIIHTTKTHAENNVTLWYEETNFVPPPSPWDYDELTEHLCILMSHTYRFSSYSRGSGTIWLDDVQCTSSDFMLATCSHNGFGNTNCYHSEDVAVSCSLSSRGEAHNHLESKT